MGFPASHEDTVAGLPGWAIPTSLAMAVKRLKGSQDTAELAEVPQVSPGLGGAIELV